MSKVFTSILETAVGIGLEFVPGAQAIGTSLIVTGVSTGVAALVESVPRPDLTETAIKMPIPERVRGYGRARATLSVTAWL